jgi:hypothetical protein
VAGPGTRIKLVDNPAVGLLRLEPSNLWVGQNADIRIAIYAPADDDTARKLKALV